VEPPARSFRNDDIVRPSHPLSARQKEILARLDLLPEADIERFADVLVDLLISAYLRQQEREQAPRRGA
jgi:hypothetical protein